ncbi:LysR family transcriptional regulator [Streptomyces iconiensis]|uniref:LysR family transcriptional regulator n=1 Tax=Streptomyces iconiensis TaxID=1384038 RepID=A0ABT7AA45_9ACTN|nr:LysR family transcriptional regulator [Streptomyces iconiensis]MDJ1138227.1 LysR family transcriptional regulator [Streptomyces iconiensis]
MDVRQLRYFLAVVDHGSVHRAAEHLFVAQPSVTQSIRRLEAVLGSSLFLRQGRGLVLSPSGAALVAPAREVVRSLDVARETVAAVDGLRGGRLRIAAMPSQVVSPLTGLIAAYARAYPLVQLAVVAAARPDDVREALRRGVAEIGVVAMSGAHEAHADLDDVPVETQSFVLVARADVPLPPGDGPLAVEELSGLRLVAGQPGTGMRRVADAIVAATDCRIAVEIEHREGLLPLVREGVGAAVVADSWRHLAEAVGLRVRRLAVEATLDVRLVWQRHRLSPAAAAFVAVSTDAEHADDGVPRNR